MGPRPGRHLVLPGGRALAAGEQASCAGLAISDHARAGEMPLVGQEIKGILEAHGLHLGDFMKGVGGAHEGSHAQCEVAALQILLDLGVDIP